jgi:tripartite-type tricarboxylate transporter receptor subunit TctC
VAAALSTAEVQKNLAALGLSAFESSQSEFKTFLAEQVRAYAELARMAKIEPQ